MESKKGIQINREICAPHAVSSFFLHFRRNAEQPTDM